jgi:hypothetical protein
MISVLQITVRLFEHHGFQLQLLHRMVGQDMMQLFVGRRMFTAHRVQHGTEARFEVFGGWKQLMQRRGCCSVRLRCWLRDTELPRHLADDGRAVGRTRLYRQAALMQLRRHVCSCWVIGVSRSLPGPDVRQRTIGTRDIVRECSQQACCTHPSLAAAAIGSDSERISIPVSTAHTKLARSHRSVRDGCDSHLRSATILSTEAASPRALDCTRNCLLLSQVTVAHSKRESTQRTRARSWQYRLAGTTESRCVCRMTNERTVSKPINACGREISNQIWKIGG